MGIPFAKAGEVVQSLARRFGLETKFLECTLQRDWRKIAGEQIGAHTLPDQVRFKKLFLIVENSVWAQQLAFLKPTLLERINTYTGGPAITDIVFRVGVVDEAHTLPPPDPHSSAIPSEPQPSPELLQEVSAHAQGIKDPDLRDRLSKIMAQALTPKSPSRSSDPREGQ